MEKRYYTFDDITSIKTGDTFKNFASLKTLPDEITTDSSLFVTIELGDNEKLEYISLKYYNTMNYWDLLVLINNVKDVTKLPRDMNTLINMVDTALYNHLVYFGIENSITNEQYITDKRAEIENDFTIENEKYRTFKIIKPNKITEFLKRLDDYVNRVNKGLV